MDDLINRQDVVDAIVKWTVEDRPNEVMPTDLIDRVNALPSAGRDGKWLNHYCDEDGYVDNAGYIEANEDGTAFVYEEYDFDEDGTVDADIVGYADEYGNVDIAAIADSDGDGVGDIVYEEHYDSYGNLVSEDYYEDTDGDGDFDLHF